MRVSYEVAKLAKEKCFDSPVRSYWIDELHGNFVYDKFNFNILQNRISRPTQSELQKFIREKRGVHIEIHRNASGYYWSMCMEDGGTDLGWSDHSGTNLGGVWDEYENALENALLVQLSYDLPTDTKIIDHWGNYAHYAMKLVKKD